MATDQTGNKKPDEAGNRKLDWRDIATKVLAGTPALALALMGYGLDVVYIVGSIAFVVIPPFAYLIGRKVKTESPILEGSGSPVTKPFAPGWLKWYAVCIPVFSVVQFVIVFAIVWFVLPIANLDDFKGDPKRRMAGPAGKGMTHIPVIVYLPNDKEDRGWRAFTLTVNKAFWVDAVRITDVRMMTVKTDYEYWQPIGVGLTNLVHTYCYSVTVPKEGGQAETVLLEDGKETEGVIELNKDRNFVPCRFDILGAGDRNGIYSVQVEVDVCDKSGGRKRTLKTEPLFAYVVPKQ